MTAEFAPVALCSAGANISAEVLQLSHADLGLLTLPEQVRNHSDLCPPVCSFFCSCLVSALLFLCFGFLKCAQWELRPALRETPVKAWVQPQLPAGCWPSSSLQLITTALLCWDSPHLQQELPGMVTEAPEHFCSQVCITCSPTGCQCLWDSSGGVGGGGRLPVTKASWCVTNQMAVV